MCPECISNIAMVAVAGVGSTGGLTAFVMQKFTRKNANVSHVESFEQQELNRNHKENYDDDDRN
jgi:hypothetical protein